MKKLALSIFTIWMTGILQAQVPGTITLNPPDFSAGLPVMKALSLRASATEFDTAMLKIPDLSNLLWAADGINREESGKRTAPSAMNAQDVDVYVVMKTGAFLYDAKLHVLKPIAPGDHRKMVAGMQVNMANAPVFCVLVSDISRFSRGQDSMKLIWAAEDAGIISQNISVFCASAGLATRPRATMDVDKLRVILKLKSSQYLMLNHPVSYRK